MGRLNNQHQFHGLSLVAALTRKLIGLALRLPGPDNIKALADAGLITAAAGWTWFVAFSQVYHPGSPVPFLTLVICARLTIYFFLKLQRMSWLHVSRHEVVRLSISAILGPPLIALLSWLGWSPLIIASPLHIAGVLITEAALYLLLLSGIRLIARALYFNHRQDTGERRRILIVGAGSTGRALAFQIQESSTHYKIVGFVDDDRRQRNRRIRGIPILGKSSEMARWVQECEAQEIVIAIPSLQPDRLRQLLAYCEPTGVAVRILPPLQELITGKADYRALREVRMEDLLPRPEVKLDREAISRYLSKRTVLVTGGGGSIGSELCRQARAAGADRLIVLGRGENSVFEMVQEMAELESPCAVIPAICDVRDRLALEQMFQRYRPQVVFHAAAHKHVPLMEQYPCEAVKNNVLGTLNVVELAVQYQVERLVMVSTDKAVDPSSVMGASKRIGEMIVQGYATQTKANMVCVRFGNVLGSRGSVVPTMTRQIRRGLAVTVTDPDMVRYFMTIPEAVQLILQAGAIGGCGEVFILDMGRPVRILDLAHDLIRLHGLVPDQDILINVIGRRPGEKVQEKLLTQTESQDAQKSGPFYVAASRRGELAVLLNQIEKLRVASQQGENDQIFRLIQGIVPEFKPETDIVRDSNGLHQNGINKESYFDNNATMVRPEPAPVR